MKRQSSYRFVVTIAVLFVAAGLAPAVSPQGEKVKVPRAPVAGVRAEIPAARAVMLSDLRRAKCEGDAAAAARLHDRLGWTDASAPAIPSHIAPEVVIRDDRPRDPLKWGGDVLVSQPDWSSGYQAMACRSDGTFYVVDVDLINNDYLDLYTSDDGGANWIYEYSLHEPAGVKYFPSIAIGEGVNDRLLIAYETARNTADARVVVFWRDLDTGGTGTVTVDTYPGNIVGRPKICVDSPEYSVWYAYLTYVRGLAGVGDYQLWFSRSLAYGETWETPMLRSLSVNYEDDHAIDFGSAGLLCAWSEKSISANIHATWSADFGATWGAPTLLASSALDEFEPSVAVSNVDDTAVVIFAVDYGGMDTDIEACVTTNGGGAWSRVYLPYNGEYELGSNLTFDPVTNTINAAYGRAKG
ncbi:glycoside hydrolase, partial [bacterium]|nr:glycoside hydrolase [bacterium]